MTRPIARMLMGLAICFISSSVQSADKPSVLPAPERISTHVWAWIGPYEAPNKANQGYRMNLAFVVGDKSVAVLDAGYSPQMAEAMLAHIKTVANKPVAYVINTNTQPHRVMGNTVFKAQGAEIVAATEAVERIEQEGQSFAGTVEGILELPAGSVAPPASPDRLISARTTLDLGGHSINVLPVGVTHTAGSLLVEIPADQVVYAGDVLYSGRLLALLPVSGLHSWIEAYESLRAFGDAIMIPGHGRPARLSAFEQPTYAYLTALKEHMDAAVEAGTFMQDAISSFDDSAWRDLAIFDELAGRNKHEAYRKQEAAAFGM